MHPQVKQQLLSGIPCRVSLPRKYVEPFISVVAKLNTKASFSFVTVHDDGCQSITNHDLSKCHCKEVEIEVTKVSHA